VASPFGVALDGAGNVYIANYNTNTIGEWMAGNNTVSTLVSSGLSFPTGVAVGGAGNVYIADNQHSAIKEWIAASNTVITLVSQGLLSYPFGVAVDGAGNVYFRSNNSINELPRAFVDPTTKTEAAAAGSDALPVVLPASANLTGPFAPMCSSPWLTITGVTNGVVSFAFTANTLANRAAHITLLGQNIPVTQAGPVNYSSLRTTNLLEGPAAGSDSAVLVANGAWTATANASWLHLSAANQSGTGSANVVFTFDTNTGSTRAGTLSIAGQTLTVTQAGSTYVAFTNMTTLVSSGLNSPYGVVVDSVGNVYIADKGNSAIKEWILTSNTVTTLVSSGLNSPYGVAVDSAGNVYIADRGNSAIKEWIAAINTVTTLVPSGLSLPSGVAVDGAGNVYLADPGNTSVKEWWAASNTVTTLVSLGLNSPNGVAVDSVGNVYIADTSNNQIKERMAASDTVNTLVSSGLSFPRGVAVDSAGNVYIADASHNAVKKWIMASNTVTTLASSGLSSPYGVAVDGSGNVFIADSGNNAIKELPRAFVDPTAKTVTSAAGSDALPVVLPSIANLTGPFAPLSDSAWLTITGVTNGVVSFSFPANYSTNRTAHITLLGQSIAVTQPAVIPPVLTGGNISGNGAFQFCFTNNQGVSFSVWTSPDMTLPFTNWTLLGILTNDGSGQFQFTDPAATNNSQGYYRISSP
jgi:DNA-binding beta-propeller fold protein YncE